MTTTAEEIRRAMRALDLDQVADYLSAQDVNDEEDDDPDNARVDAEDIESDQLEDTDAVEPYQVCDGVSVDVFNEYVGDGEGLRIGVRFLELTDDGRLVVIELPSGVHETTASEFESGFLDASGNRREIKQKRCVTANRPGQPSKEPDTSFGPLSRTPHRAPPPQGLTVPDWLTLVVEVGRTQSWASLRNAAMWWYGYPGVEYVLLIKISRRAWILRYQLFGVQLRPLRPRGGLPPPLRTGRIRHNDNRGQRIIAFDARRILGISAGMPLPAGVNDPITVDLRDVMTNVIDSIAL